MRRTAGFTLIEAIVIVLIVVLALLVLGPALLSRPETPSRTICSRNLGQIVKACVTYQEANGDYFPAQSQYTSGTTDVFLPMPSLAMLYPAYIDSVKVFSCRATMDRPEITVTYLPVGSNPKAIRHIDFGPVTSSAKCSYFYDERSHFRTVGPSQAMACDADGMTYLTTAGTYPSYKGYQPSGPGSTWTRLPAKPNHENGQNVMYFDGHVRWSDSPYASDDPKDNIFCPNGGSADGTGQWGADTDAYLWDGVNGRQRQLD